MKFRYKRGIPVSYEWQGYVYFKSLRYSELPESEQMRIRRLCLEVCKFNHDALLEHVTTGASVKDVCAKHHIASPTTIYRALRRYYLRFPQDL